MHARIIDEHARPLAALMAALHPGWDIPGCRAALWNAKDRADVYELAHAAIELARRTDLRSPAVLAEDGPHWGKHQTPTGNEHRIARCDVIGHGSYPAHNCGACRAEDLEADEPPTPPPPPAPGPGADLVRAAMRQHGIPVTDRHARQETTP